MNNFLMIVLIAIITKSLFPTFLYLAGFLAIRSMSGGYHADTHLRCMMTMLLVYLLYLLMLKNLTMDFKWILSGLFFAFSLILNVTLSPVDNYNKPLNMEEISFYKKRSIALVVALTIIALATVFLTKKIDWSFSIATGMVTVSISLIAGTVKNQKCHRLD